MLERQKTKFNKDWTMVTALHKLPLDLYKYYWLLVNTRCFYWDYPTAPRAKNKRHVNRRKVSSDDCMALCPFADFFNHASHGLNFDSNHTGCFVTCDRDYDPGVELYISYGRHTNDFLLVEYGFVLPNNDWDAISLDSTILPMLKASQRTLLDEHNMLHNYTLGPRADCQPCYRTQVALRVECLPKRAALRFMDGFDDGGPSQQAFIDQKCQVIIMKMAAGVQERLTQLKGSEKNPHRDVLVQYYEETAQMLQSISILQS
jgi:hypothetical protein